MRCKSQLIRNTIFAGFTAMVALCAQRVVAQGDHEMTFPYQAQVANEGALVRSGPGRVHYATSRLARNDTVEVYQHDPGGWCAIRPVDGSFCLVPEEAIEILEDGIGQITKDRTKAWVGTELGPVDKPLGQVPLSRGEQVEILGQASWPTPDGLSTTWYQIAPPAGEFRWIHESDLQRPPTLEDPMLASRPSPEQTIGLSTVTQTRYEPPVIPATYQEATNRQQPMQRSLNAVNRGWRQASRPAGNRFSTELQANDRFHQSVPVSSPAQVPGANWHSAERLASASVDPSFDLRQIRPTWPREMDSGFSAGNPGSTNTQPLTGRLTELELKLNNEMIKKPQQWRLIDIQTVAESIYESTSDPLERLQAQRLLEKLANCRKIRSGYQDVFTPAGTTNQNGAFGSGVALQDDLSLNATYDAYGWLNELIRDGGQSVSTFVLQDDDGKITHHVAAAPGLNINRFLKSKVGIIGQRGYHNGLRLDHVTAERVIELKRR